MRAPETSPHLRVGPALDVDADTFWLACPHGVARLLSGVPLPGVRVANDGDVTKNLGRGLVQINLRLAKILEAIEGAGPSSSDAALALLLDLLDAVERTLGDAHLGPPAPFWVRWLPARVGPDLAGLRLARDQVRDRLEAMGISPVADRGPVDPVLHNVIDTRPTTDESRSGTIAATHQRGWVRRGDPPAVVRHALVTAYARSS